MNTYTDKTQKNKPQAAVNSLPKLQSSSESALQFAGNLPEAAQRKQQEAMNNSPGVKQLKAYQEMANSSPQVKQLRAYQALADSFSSETAQRKENSDKELVQGKLEAIQKKENDTGLPDNLKTGIESLSGYSMNDVKVHYNSDKPAQLQAHAYAQGTDIHIGSGQERHLPHEAWHVVQQKQGRVKPTLQMKGRLNVNDDAELEREADMMGMKAWGLGRRDIQEHAGIPDLTPGYRQNNSETKQLTKISHAVVQLAEWKAGEGEGGATHYWDELMDGVMWFSNGTEIWYKIQAPGREDYKALEGHHKTLEEWHELRRITHPEEYPDVAPERPDYAADLMDRYRARYETVIKWADGSGTDESLDKVIVIDASVKKPDGGSQSVYQNSYQLRSDSFSADWNQRTTDVEVGIKDPPALFNSDLLTCHREMARNFAISEGVQPPDDSHGFEVARHNINNDDWQNHIYPQLPIKVKGMLSQGIVATRDAPMPFTKPVSIKGKSAANMWEIFEKLIPNTQAVFRMIAQRYPGFTIVAWRFKSGTATAVIRK